MASGGSGSGKGESFAKRRFYGAKKRKHDESDDDNGGQVSDISVDDSVDDPDFKKITSSSSSDDGDDVEQGNQPGISGVSGVRGVAGGDNSSDSGDDGVEGEQARGRGRQRDKGRGRGKTMEKVGRSRVRGEWEKKKAQRLRNEGKEYKSLTSGKIVPERKPGSPCRDGCFTRLNEEARSELFRAFWDLKEYEKQNAYIAQRVTPVPVKRRYRQPREDRRQRLIHAYHVTYLGEKVRVCQKAFLSIHGIKRKRVDYQLSKIRASPTGTPPGDQRGKGPSVNKITGEKLKCVHDHIKSLPTTTSHYTRAKSPHRKYLEAGGTIKGLYDKYKVWLSENHPNVDAVSFRFYTKVFTEEYNIAFRAPKKDTCSTCDVIKATIEGKRSRNEDITEEEEALAAHQARGKLVQDLLKEKSGEQEEEEGMVVRNVAMDLQQTLPCPRLSTGIAYYLRKLWVYNFCIYDMQKRLGSMFVWDEVTGGRGSDEIASCLMKWLDMRLADGDDFDVLRIFCDNCAGQNKNINVILAALRMLHAKKLFRIEIVFMISGHSFLPCDRAFGVIEKKLRVAEDIQTTVHYVNTIKSATNPPYEVIAMKREEFFDVKILQSYVTQRHKQQSHVSLAKACQLVVSNHYNEGFIIKTDYNLADTPENTNRCRLMKGTRKYSNKFFDLSAVPLPSKYEDERVLNEKKVKDLETLSNYLWPVSKQWMLDLVARQRELAGAVQNPEEENVGSDAENDLQDYDDPIPVVSH